MLELEPIVARPAVRIPRQAEAGSETTIRFAPLSGILSGLLNAFEHKSSIFIINFAGATIAGFLIVLMLPRLKRVMRTYLGE